MNYHTHAHAHTHTHTHTHTHDFTYKRFFIDCNQRQPNLPLSVRINTGSLHLNVSIINYERDKDRYTEAAV